MTCGGGAASISIHTRRPLLAGRPAGHFGMPWPQRCALLPLLCRCDPSGSWVPDTQRGIFNACAALSWARARARARSDITMRCAKGALGGPECIFAFCCCCCCPWLAANALAAALLYLHNRFCHQDGPAGWRHDFSSSSGQHRWARGECWTRPR